MDADRRDLIHHLFALATELAEAAHETAASGQASDMPRTELIRVAAALDRHADDLQAIARAIGIAARLDHTEPSPEQSS